MKKNLFNEICGILLGMVLASCGAGTTVDYTKASDKGSTSTSRPAGSVTTTRPSGTATTTTTTRSGSSSTVRPSGSTSRPTGTTYTGSGNSRSGASGTSTSIPCSRIASTISFIKFLPSPSSNSLTTSSATLFSTTPNINPNASM